MAKHNFEQSVTEDGGIVGARCTQCGQIALFENGRIPDEIQTQECRREDANKAAARIARQVTEKN